MINETIVLGPKVLLCDSALDAWRLFFKRLKLLAKGALVFISDAVGSNDENQVEDPFSPDSGVSSADQGRAGRGLPWGRKSLGEYNPGDSEGDSTPATISEKGKKGEKQPHPRP